MRVRVMVVVGAMAALLAGCSGGLFGGDDSTTTAITTSVASADTAPAASTCPDSDELFCALSPHAFVQTGSHGAEISPFALGDGVEPADEVPVTLNGVNLKQGPYRQDGRWTTDLAEQELDALAATGAPAFSVVRIPLDWPRFQYRNPAGKVVIDEEGLAALDRVVAAAAERDLHVILDLIHVRAPDGPCDADERLLGAKWDVPAWAWDEVGGTNPDDDCKARPNELGDLMDEVLALPETTDYLRTVIGRYSPETTRGRNVVAVEPVSEAEASGDETGSAVSRTQTLVDDVYARWVAPDGPGSLRTAGETKILILSPNKGDASLDGVDLTAIAGPNVVWSHHDYTLAVTSSGAAGDGYTDQGWVTGETQERAESPAGTPAYNPEVVSYGDRLRQRREYVAQKQRWAAQQGLPIFVGEYGVLNTCVAAGSIDTDTEYAKHSTEIFDSATVNGTPAPLSRTWWQLSQGGAFGGEFSLVGLNGRTCPGADADGWMPYAFDLTSGEVR